MGTDVSYSIGDCIVYGCKGIFTISNIISDNIGNTGDRLYYVLTEVNSPTDLVIYVPYDADSLVSKMRKVLTKHQIEQIISSVEHTDDIWINDHKQRASQYEKILKEGNKENVLRVAKALALKKHALKSEKKKLSMTDERILSLAEEMLKDEFSFVLNIDKSDVVPYIIKNSSKK
ncbi:MAG: hypothetical protein E7315_05925 [Clostridiales bacterium]|nr:hypothetical protein [Clostridiales bacterium]